MDIVSLDLQRSRDHGIPSYVNFRKYCGLKAIRNEQDLAKIMMEGVSSNVFEILCNRNILNTLCLYSVPQLGFVGP